MTRRTRAFAVLAGALPLAALRFSALILKGFVAFVLLASVPASAAGRPDVVVVGGGASGCMAAIAAARLGSTVALVEELPWLGGMLTSAGVSAVDGNYNMRSGLFGEFEQRLADYYGGWDKLRTGWVSHVMFEPHVGERILSDMLSAERNVTVHRRTQFVRAARQAQGWCVTVRDLCTGVARTLPCKVLIDGTELGDVAASLGVPCRIGFDARSDTHERIARAAATNIVQDLTVVAILKDYGPGADKTIPRPAGYDPRVFANCCSNRINAGFADGKKLHEPRTMLNYGRLPGGKYMINWPTEGNDTYLNLVEKTPAARTAALEAARNKTLGFVHFIQTVLGFRNLGLADDEFATPDKLAYIPYHRESRRICGEAFFILDAIERPYDYAFYRAGCAVGDYPVDHHHKAHPDRRHLMLLPFYPVPSYCVPAGVVVPLGVEDFLVAEKSPSVSNLANGTTRLQPVVSQLGQVAGTLAALAVRRGVAPRRVRVRELQRTLLDAGMYIQPFRDLPKDSPDFKVLQRIGCTGILRGEGKPSGWANETWFRAHDKARVCDLWLEDYYGVPHSADATPLTCGALAKIIGGVKGKEISVADPDVVLTRLEAARMIDAELAPFDAFDVDWRGNLLRPPFRLMNVLPYSPGEEARLAREAAATAARTGFNEVLYCLTCDVEGAPAAKKVDALCASFRAFRDAAAEKGLRVGVLLQAIVGHWPHDVQPTEPWTPTRGLGGKEGARRCVLDPRFAAYVRETAAKIARERPAFLLGDDDIRPFGYVGEECFCDRHAAAFAQRTGRAACTSAEVRRIVASAARGSRDEQVFRTLQREAVNGVCRLVREGLDAVDPTIDAGVCLPMAREEPRFYDQAARAIAGAGRPTLMRVGNGQYLEREPRTTVWRVLSSYAIAELHGDVDWLLDEADTYPQTLWSRSAVGMHAKICMSALCGFRGALTWYVGTSRGRFRVNEAYDRIIGENAGLYRALAEAARATVADGVAIPLPSVFPDADAPIAEGDGWGDKVCAAFGVPFRCTTNFADRASVFALAGARLVSRLSDGELKALLAGRVLVDGAAAEALAKRGFERLLGVRVGASKRPPFVCELAADGTRLTLSSSADAAALSDPDPKAVVLSHLANGAYAAAPQLARVAPATTVFTNALGGVVAVTAWKPTLAAGFNGGPLNEARRQWFLGVLAAVGGAPLPVVADHEQDVLVQARVARGAVREGGGRLLLVSNLGYDPIPKIRLRCATRPRRIAEIAGDGARRPVAFAWADGVAVLERALPCYGVAALEVTLQAAAELHGRVTGLERISAKNARGAEVRAWSGACWRNERVHAPFVVWGDGVDALHAEVGALVGPGGATIPARVRWVGEVLVDDRPHGAKVDPVRYPPYLSGDVLDATMPFRLTDAGYRALWVSAKTPAEAAPGVYRGRMTVRGGGRELAFPIALTVRAATLPKARKFHLDIWQTPWTIARYYGVKPFSPEHYAKMAPYLRELADAGQKAITTTITDYPWNVRENIDSARSMVKYVKRRDGTFAADFAVMDAYVAFAESCGIGPQIHCYAPVKFERSNTYQYLDEATGREVSVKLLPATPAYEAYWGPLLAQLEAHARAKGWANRLYVALDELPGAETAATAALIAKYAPSAKFHMAGNRDPAAFKGIRIDGYSQMLGSGFMTDAFLKGLAARRRNGQFTTLYTCCLPFRPNALPMSPLYEQRWLGLYIAAKGFDGYLKSTFFRWTPGADPLKDAHCYPSFPCGDSYLVYPGPRSSLRWESLVDGIEDCEKIRVLRAGGASTPALEAALGRIDMSSFRPGGEPAARAVRAALEALDAAASGLSEGK